MGQRKTTALQVPNWLKPNTLYTVEIPGVGTYRVRSGPRGMTATSAVTVAIVALTKKIVSIPLWNEIRVEGTRIIAQPKARITTPPY